MSLKLSDLRVESSIFEDERPATVADLVDVLREEGGEEVMVEFSANSRCYLVSGAALNDGVHLIYPIPVAR